MDYSTLRIIHLTGLALTFMGLTGVLASKATGQTLKKTWLYHLSHGVGLLLLLATGIALGLKLGMVHPAPLWVRGKFAVWLLAGGAMFLATRFSRFAGPLVVLFALLVFAGAWLAISKPF